jgi:cell wall-associated NlpC family hydrolase
MPTKNERVQTFVMNNLGKTFAYNSDSGIDCLSLTKRYLKNIFNISLPDKSEYYDQWETNPEQVAESILQDLRDNVPALDLETETLQVGDVFGFRHQGNPSLGLIVGEDRAVSVSQTQGIIELYPSDYTILEAFRPPEK